MVPEARRYKTQFAALIAALILYALAGSPTPDSPGIVELLTGGLLVYAALPAVIGMIVSDRRSQPRWQRTAFALLCYGMSVPLLAGVINGNAAAMMIRDLIPFLFFLAPLFFIQALQADRNSEKILIFTVALAGVLFSLRAAAPLLPYAIPTGFLMPSGNEMLYLANAPTVLFAAVLLSGMGMARLGYSISPGGVLIAAFCFAVASFPVLAMAGAVQRATFAFFALALAAFLAFMTLRSPVRAILPVLAASGLILYFQPQFQEFLGLLVNKTMAVGMNNRIQEAAAVLETLDGGVLTVLFGNGWGATFVSPATGGQTANFTHNLFTAFWMKTGLAGTLLAGVYLWRIFSPLRKIFLQRTVLLSALTGPALISTFLYASYKSLDYGAILLLAVLVGHRAGLYSMDNDKQHVINNTPDPNATEKQRKALSSLH